ncbi:uncharacterized protein BDZ99DRAFT_572173 [Mytilinidion resinicola]|uniref:Uncharacterized protein n=1 Tax=Mytilinidion resinicola TaxID=574789 RepID=A0A6A6YIA3_9PEZI|nr:uncharacterized protein BDZ99DRAFT_572173 [Mytilinidion resinicola]KAF2808288.1 hypothetical protein BDZ99DRAFT_572173 [Mytilinidion resinicola]
MMSSMSSVAGAYTGGSVRISDWTRYSKTRNASVLPMAISMPLTVTLGALIGILVTSATNNMYGVVIWNPLLMLQYVQSIHYTAACRAGTFFTGVGLISSQVFVNITQNGMSSGMDIAAILPRYIDIRRGCIVICVVGIVIQPWRFLTQALTFLTVLSSFAVFIAPMAGTIFADFWIVRKQIWKIPDLYSEDGIYWYTADLNWRAFFTFFMATWPSMAGFVCAINKHPIAEGWTRIYQLSYFVGLIISIPMNIGTCKHFPPEGLFIAEAMDDSEILEGAAPADQNSNVSVGGVEDTEKGARSKETPIEYGQL